MYKPMQMYKKFNSNRPTQFNLEKCFLHTVCIRFVHMMWQVVFNFFFLKKKKNLHIRRWVGKLGHFPLPTPSLLSLLSVIHLSQFGVLSLSPMFFSFFDVLSLSLALSMCLLCALSVHALSQCALSVHLSLSPAFLSRW
jgi:hypothetical protein